jgi:hypothetical protein
MSKYSSFGIYSYGILGGMVGGGIFGMVNGVRHSLKSEFGWVGDYYSIKHDSLPMRIGLTTFQIIFHTLTGSVVCGTFVLFSPIIVPCLIPATIIVVATKD